MSKEKINFCIILSSSLFLGILTDILLFEKEAGISFFIFIATTIALSLVISKRSEKKINKIQMLFLAAALILSAEVFLRASHFLNFFDTIGSLYLLILSGILSTEENFFGTWILRFIGAPVMFILGSFKSSAKFITEQECLVGNKEKFGSDEFRSVIKGVIMSLPLLLVLGAFLYSADLVVQAYANKLFDLLYFKIDLDLVTRLFVIFVASYVLVGVFAKITGKEKITETEEENKPKRSTGFIESMTVLSLVEALFLAFISIQFFYLFGGKNYVWGLDTYVTYSEYAKSGFSELIVVAIISFILIYVIDRSSRIETPKQRKTFKFLSAVLFIEISIILFSSLKRLLLYVDGYGLTLTRFLAFALLFWIFSVFLLILCKIFLKKKNSVFVFLAFSLTVAVWVGINILNPDAFIARVNIERFAQGKKLDPYYFSGLSDDAAGEIIKVFKMNVSDEIKETIAMGLNRRYAFRDYNCDIMPYNNSGYFNTYGISQCKPVLFSEKIKGATAKSPWQSYNLAEANALKILRDNASQVDKYQISYWKKAVIECKKNATECEKTCVKNTWQANDDCKTTCNLSGCKEFEKNIQQYE